MSRRGSQGLTLLESEELGPGAEAPGWFPQRFMSTDDARLPPHDQLDGWKEIAACLGKSVRAAQRWERDMGLPVHRLKTPGGQVIFARRSEIEAWKARVEVPPDEPGDENGDVADGLAGKARRGAGRDRASWPIAAALVTLAAVILVAALVWRPDAPGERPVRFQFVGRDLEARDGRGALAWTHRFPLDVGELVRDHARAHLQTVQVDDLDGDGRRELVVLVQRGSVSGRGGGVETMEVLTEGGDLLWEYAPDLAWTFGGRRFDGPWVVLDLLIAGGPGARQIWVAYGHNPWWPGFVVRLDRRGEASVRFVQSGLVYGLGYGMHDGRAFVLAVGVNNEYASAAVAVLEADGPPAVSPQSAESAYRCDDCPGGAPARYFLLPPTEVSRLFTSPYNAAVSVNVSGTSIQIATREWDTRDVAVFYRLSPSFEPESVDFSDGYWTVHHTLEGEGRIDHSAEDCPERVHPKIVREWVGGAWREIQVPVNLALVPGVKR